MTPIWRRVVLGGVRVPVKLIVKGQRNNTFLSTMIIGEGGGAVICTDEALNDVDVTGFQVLTIPPLRIAYLRCSLIFVRGSNTLTTGIGSIARDIGMLLHSLDKKVFCQVSGPYSIIL
jgi:hypothetical protein